jgi:hypothetical protein
LRPTVRPSMVAGQVHGERRCHSRSPGSMAEPNSSPDPRSSTGNRPYLVVVAGFGIGRAFAVLECTRIGRDPEGEVVLPYWTVSWRHLTVSYRDGIVVAEDLGSRNGTFVGVDKIKRRELAEGDVLAIGDSIALSSSCMQPQPAGLTLSRDTSFPATR